ncbi:hypothetical protein VTN00DRAFT_9626 [Thermoascus crustaceus]|uniref:uncharacterized protein n=1 Tax=Thermoascus crustaceus TaxID=5088 RepID=UPI0037427AEE
MSKLPSSKSLTTTEGGNVASPSGSFVEDIPKAFLAVATRQERVNGKCVGVGDKRMQLHRDLDNLAQSVESLQSVFKSLLSHSAGDLFPDASAQVEQFNTSLSRFRATKTEYDELDDKLCGEEYLLSEDEKKVYNRLSSVNGPHPQAFNKSISSFHFSVPACLAEGPLDDLSSV